VVGKIDGYELNADGESVTVHAFINEPYVEFVRANTRFWNASGIDVSVGMNGVEVDMESLASLIEGGIAFDTPGSPGDAATTGARYTLYRHRDDAMGSRKAMRGRHFVLGSPKLGGVSDGSKVYYRDVPVGQVERHEVSEDGGSVDIHIVVESRHADLVRENSRFWNASGIEFSGGFSGVDFSMESIQSVIAGGVAFDTPSGRGKPAKSDARFTLHANRRDAMRVYAESRGLDVIVETPRLGSLKVGDSVYYREEPVGRVVSHELHADGRSVGILLEIDRPYAKLVRTNTIFWNASGFSADLSLTGIHVHTESMAALLSGGVGFATPDNPGPRAAAGSVFELQSKMKDDWLKWSPRIWVGPEGKDPGRSAAAAAGTPVKEKPPVKVHHKPEAAKDKESHHWFPHLRHRRH
jgi:paraquat-inducible protein B